MPVGTGGTISDGTYVLSAQTYYADANCPQQPLSATLVTAGDCWQEVAQSNSDKFTASFTGVVRGNQFTVTLTCSSIGASQSTPTSTFTATGQTLTVFTLNSAAGNSNPDMSDVFTKQ
jgi:hypothetical protein